MDAKTVAGVLAFDMFHFRRHLIVSNVSWGLLPWEADLLVMTASGYVSEVEIKISIADLKRDKAKRKFLQPGWDWAHNLLKARWYAMPESVWAHKDAAAAVPAEAGVIAIYSHPVRSSCSIETKSQLRARIERRPEENKSARKLSDAEQFQLARLGTMRHWSKLAREFGKAA